MRKVCILIVILSIMLVTFVGCGDSSFDIYIDKDDSNTNMEKIINSNDHYIVVNTGSMKGNELQQYLNMMHDKGYRLVSTTGRYTVTSVIWEKIDRGER